MARQRRFARLGEHVARNTAAEVRRAAAAGDPDAIQELRKLEAGLTLAGLQDKSDDILSQMLARAAKTLTDCGHATPPLTAESSVAEHGRALLAWAGEQSADLDSLEGRMIEVVRLCALALIGSDTDNTDFLLGLVLGYGIAQKYFLAFREYSDGPALARERAQAEGRAEGGRQRAASLSAERDRAARSAYEAARAKNPSLSARSWAMTYAVKDGRSADRLARIVRKLGE